MIEPRNTSDAPGTDVRAELKPPAVNDSAVERVSPRARSESWICDTNPKISFDIVTRNPISVEVRKLIVHSKHL